MAVHYADGGSGRRWRGENPYHSPEGFQALYGNCVYGDLDLDDVIRKLPMLECLDSRYKLNPPYPFGGNPVIPKGWNYLYMGCMNHFFVRTEILEQADLFVSAILKRRGNWCVFDAVAWLFTTLC